MGVRNDNFNAGHQQEAQRAMKTRYRVGDVGMVAPPRVVGYGQIAPSVRAGLEPHHIHWDALPPTDVSLKRPVRASQATVAKSKVDKVPRRQASPEDPIKAIPYKGGVHLIDGHHRTAHAMVNGQDSIPMAVFDPSNPRHVAHAAKVASQVSELMEPLRDHRSDVIHRYGFAGNRMVQGEEADAARATFRAHQNEVMAKVDRVKADARTRWLA